MNLANGKYIYRRPQAYRRTLVVVGWSLLGPALLVLICVILSLVASFAEWPVERDFPLLAAVFLATITVPLQVEGVRILRFSRLICFSLTVEDGRLQISEQEGQPRSVELVRTWQSWLPALRALPGGDVLILRAGATLYQVDPRFMEEATKTGH